ncbi:MAG: type II secretion system protein N [Pseudomonadales bacterium]|nr:type II secretion system protein N [Pseudomonadales bacterium]
MRLALYTALGFVVFAIALAVFAPAALLTRFIPEGSPLQVKHPSGMLWRGKGALEFDSQSVAMVRWRIAPRHWLDGRLGIDYELGPGSFELEGELTTGGEGTLLTATGQISEHWINQRLGAYDISVQGELSLEAVQLWVGPLNDMPPQMQLEGNCHWSGGATEFALSGTSFLTSLPAMAIELTTENERFEATVGLESHPERELFRVSLEHPTGWVHVGVTGHFLDLINWPRFDSLDPSRVLIEVSERLYDPVQTMPSETGSS